MALRKGICRAVGQDEAISGHQGETGFLHFFSRVKHTKQSSSNYTIREVECHGPTTKLLLKYVYALNARRAR